jgi:hypothetical protein
MATYTTNLSLIKPAGTDKIRIAQINQNMDTIDAAIGAVGNTSLQTQVTGISDSMNAVEGGIAIVSNSNTHVAITSGQYVYVKNHATLSEGLYRATQAIATNGTLTLSNVTPESAGGLNSLNEQIANIVKRKSVSITTNEFGWLLFPLNELVICAIIENTYNPVQLTIDNGTHGIMAKAYFNIFEGNRVLFENSTSYNIQYYYIEKSAT